MLIEHVHSGYQQSSTSQRILYFHDQAPALFSGHPWIVAAPLEGLNEINAALV